MPVWYSFSLYRRRSTLASGGVRLRCASVSTEGARGGLTFPPWRDDRDGWAVDMPPTPRNVGGGRLIQPTETMDARSGLLALIGCLVVWLRSMAASELGSQSPMTISSITTSSTGRS